LLTSVDGYSNGGGGYNLTEQDSINYIRQIASEAAKLGMSTGLKNAQEILSSVIPSVHFAVNEQCATSGDCASYKGLLAAGKPVFHIEYADYHISAGTVNLTSSVPGLAGLSTEELRAIFCLEAEYKNINGTHVKHRRDETPTSQFSTVTKGLLLDGFVYYCDKEWANSDTMNVGTGGPTAGYCDESARKGRKPHPRLR
jgi:Glycoside-hydrolase family GH114